MFEETCIQVCDDEDGYELAGLYKDNCYCANKRDSLLTKGSGVP